MYWPRQTISNRKETFCITYINIAQSIRWTQNICLTGASIGVHCKGTDRVIASLNYIQCIYALEDYHTPYMH